MFRRILSDKQILDMKEKYSSGKYTQRDFAEEYDCSITTISLWLKPNPYEILQRKIRKAKDYSSAIRCEVCTRVLKYEGETCDCTVKKKYFSDFEDLSSMIK